jgi:hypothetical protein
MDTGMLPPWKYTEIASVGGSSFHNIAQIKQEKKQPPEHATFGVWRAGMQTLGHRPALQ